MPKKTAITMGFLTLLIFTLERLISLNEAGEPYRWLIFWLRSGFFVAFLCQVIATITVHFQDTDRHLDGFTHAMIFITIPVTVLCIWLYDVLLILLNVVVKLFSPIFS